MIHHRRVSNSLTLMLATLVPCLGVSPLPGCSCRRAAPSADGASAAAPDGGTADAAFAPSDDAAGRDRPTVDPATILNLDRFPGLTSEHLRRLENDGFFLAGSPARGLFEVYERNERLGLPSFVTPALLLDVVRGVAAAVERDVEESFVAPAVYRALHALVQRGIDLRRRSLDDPPGELEALDRTIAIFAVGAHLLAGEGARASEESVPSEDEGEYAEAHPEAGFVPLLVPLVEIAWPELPGTARVMFQEAVSRLRAADDVYVTAILGRQLDFRVFRSAEVHPSPRGRALLRTLLWLDAASPATAADLADNLVGPLAVRLFGDARAGDDDVRDLWSRASRLLQWCGRGWHGTDANRAVDALRRTLAEGDELPASGGGSIRALLAASGAPPRGTMGFLPVAVDAERCAGCDETTRWLGPAAPFGPSAVAQRPGLALGGSLAPEPEAGAAPFGRLRTEPEAWRALSRALEPWGTTEGVLSRRPAPPVGRAVPSCIPAGNATPHGAVASVLPFFDDVAGAVAQWRDRLRVLGVLPEREIEDPRSVEASVSYRIQELLASVELYARVLAGIVRTDLRGEPWSEDQVASVARVGGWAESILADAAMAAAVDPGDPRWAAAGSGGSVAGVGGTDILYIVIDTPEGPVLARGAVHAFRRDLPWPFPDVPVTDEAWRAWLDSADPPPRPPGAAERLAPPFPPPPLVGDGNRSCLGADSGGDLPL